MSNIEQMVKMYEEGYLPVQIAVEFELSKNVVKSRLRRYYEKLKHPELLEQEKLKRQQIRQQVIEAYGRTCVCCGESTQEFLTIDHINGRAPREKRGMLTYERLVRNGFPKENYQLLCFNCNCAKGIYGVCPHMRNKWRI